VKKADPAAKQLNIDRDNGIVAIIDSPNPNTVVIWWVSLFRTFEGDGSNLCGAWFFSADQRDEIESVVYRVLWLPTSSGLAATTNLGIVPGPIVNANAVLLEVMGWGDRVEAAITAEKLSSTAKRNLKDFVLPTFPAPLDLEMPPTAFGCPDDVAVALGVARWLGKVFAAWHQIETRRLGRKSTRALFGAERRALPIVCE